MAAAQRIAFSRGLAENNVIDQDSGKHTPGSQNRSGKVVALECVVVRQIW
jgi:hypothetical protein